MPPVPHASDSTPRPSQDQPRAGSPPQDRVVDPSGELAGDASEPEPEPLGATEEQVGDRTGPGAGYDQEPRQEKDKGGVTPS